MACRNRAYDGPDGIFADYEGRFGDRPWWATAERATWLVSVSVRGRRFDPTTPLSGLALKLLAISNAWRRA